MSSMGDPSERSLARERQSHVRHELRAPIAVMYPLLSLLLDEGAGELSAQQREYLEVLERSVLRIEALVTGAEESGWADCSAAPAEPSAIALGDVLREIVSLRRTAGQDGPPVAVEAVAGAPCAWADRDDVRQIVTNLVRNAVTYTPAEGRVVIRAAAGEGPRTAVVEVEDTGPGMPAEELARAFEFGFRGELAMQVRAPGLGAGLWICRELAARNGGRVRLASEPGAGLRATLSLPACDDSPGAAAPS
jgi:two-component system sensor histidine kinase GlrK